MSARMEVRAIRLACDAVGMDDAWGFCESHAGDPAFDAGAYPDFHYPHFEATGTPEREYLDYVLSEKVHPGPDYFARSRALTKDEQKKYLPVFSRLFPSLDPAGIRYVHYCFYDGGDPPDVYM